MSVRLRVLSLPLSLAVLTAVIPILSGCGYFAVTDPSFYAGISAPGSTLRVNQQMQLKDNARTTGVPVIFFVNGVQGGNAEFGTIDSNGLYTAPAIVPVPNTVAITTTTAKFPNDPPGAVAIGVLNPIPALTSVTPTGFSEGTTMVTVSGSQFVYGAQIMWNGAAVPTTFVSSTQLVASIPAPNPGTFPLAVSNPNPGSVTTKPISVKVGPGQVVLTLQAYEGTDVRVSNPLNLGLTVTGTDNPAVNLFVNGVAGGNAQIGTAVSNSDGSITYTAPAVVPSPNVVQLTVTSVDNPAVSINHNISVLNPIPILSSATPSSFNVGPASVVVQGQNFISGAQVLMNGAAVPTTFNSGG
ncbi:MAG: IPT/TIG domain-containing protein, partial [Terracidiphilus sp.]